MKLLNVPEKLPDLIGFRLAPAALQIKRAWGLRMLINVMAAVHAVQAVVERFDHLAQVRKVDVLRTDQQFFVNLARTH